MRAMNQSVTKSCVISNFNFCTHLVLFSAIQLQINRMAFSQSNFSNFVQYVTTPKMLLALRYLSCFYFCVLAKE